METPYSEILAAFVERIRYDQLPIEVREMAKNCFLDWLGCTLASKNEPAVRNIAKVARSSKGMEQSTVIPYAEKNSALLSALVNGAASHALEIDDVHRDSVLHAATVVIPAAFAVAEREKVSGTSLIEAIVSGYEAMIRVGEGVGRSHYLLWHNTSTCGTFGAAVGVGKILDLNVEQYIHALGNAGSQSSGLWEFLEDGANTKLLHTGKAAINGIIAADLAKLDFTGARRIFEGERGFYRATSKDFELDKLIRGLDDNPIRFKILCNSFKRYPSCRHTHSMIDGTLELISENDIPWQTVEKVDIYTYSAAINLCGRVELKNPYVAKWHIPFAVATALKYRRVDVDSYTESRLREQELLDLTKKVSLQLESELDALYPSKWPARVRIYAKGGGYVEKTVFTPKGDPENPLTKVELAKKFRDVTSGVLSTEDAEDLANKVDRLEHEKDLSSILEGIEL